MNPAWEVRLPPHPSAVVSQMLAYWDKTPNAQVTICAECAREILKGLE